jgi:peptide/nickel transport system substrate-binding protein
MSRRRLSSSKLLALAGLVVALALTACGGGDDGGGTGAADGEGQSGGTYRVGWENAFGFTNNFDPTGEYLGEAQAIYSSLLIRTLVGYNHVAGVAGNEVVPDLATEVPEPTNNGTTYTFTLKEGIRFGPPVSRAITSEDVRYAFERMAKPDNGAQYGFYYEVIRGFEEFGDGNAPAISGIETPDERTIVFNLTEPTGDFLFRLGMPAAGPIPEEVAKCFDGRPGAYGRSVVSSGPYMVEGSDAVDASSCSALKPTSGFNQTRLALVRNPEYDPDTDSPAARENFPDRFEWTVNSNTDDILSRVQAGELDDEISGIPPQVLRQYVTDSSLSDRLHQNSGDRTWYLTMNLTQPPFDDINVRRAMNWVMDKAALVQAWGGPALGDVAKHIAPDTLLNEQLSDYAPYATEGNRGDVQRAKEAMRGSKYDLNGNGMCSAPECKNVLLLADVRQVDVKMVPVIQQSARKIGITFAVRSVEGAYPVIQTPRRNIPIAERPGWGKDYADPYTFFNPLFDGRSIQANGNTNYSLVGITPAIAAEVGAKGTVTGVPNVDADLDRCAGLAGNARLTCYGDLDRKLMEDVVPWVPYLWSYATHITGPNVTKWEFDQFAGSTAYAHVAVGG